MKPQETIEAKDYRKLRTLTEREKLERKFAALWLSLGGPILATQVAAFLGSRHLFDFGDHAARVLIEIHGGIWRAKGAHNTGKAMIRDAYKLRMATYLGWRVLVFTSEDIERAKLVEAIEYVRRRHVHPTN